MFSANWTKSDAYNALGVWVILNAAFGLWPLHKDNLFLKARCFVSIFDMGLMLICCLYEMYFTCDYADDNVDLFLIMSFGVEALVKLIFYYVHRDKLRLNVESAIEDWSSIKTSEINSIMYSSKKICRTVTRIYLVIGATASSMYFLKVFFFDQDSFVMMPTNDDLNDENTIPMLRKRFIFPSVCSFNNVSETLYRAINLNQFLQFIICVSVNLFADTFFVTITYHLCGQFEILKRGFASFEGLENEIETRREFGILVARYNHLLKLGEYLESSVNLIVFTQILINVILINVAGFNFLIFLKKSEKYGVMTNLAILIFTLVQTFLYAYMGENISGEVEGITQSIYDGPWQTMPKSISKDIIFLMIRSNTTIYLTAGKFFKMTKSTFTDVVKTSVSYLSVWHALIKD